MKRPEMLGRVQAHSNAWDMIVVGGGATGVGVAIDAATRGYEALLLEQNGGPSWMFHHTCDTSHQT